MAKGHTELKAKERSSLASLEKALMESNSEIEGEAELGQRKELVEDEMFEAFMAEQTFLIEKPTGTDHKRFDLNEVASTKVPGCSMEDASEITEQVSSEKKQVQPAVQFGSFPPMSVNVVYILPQEFQAIDGN